MMRTSVEYATGRLFLHEYHVKVLHLLYYHRQFSVKQEDIISVLDRVDNSIPIEDDLRQKLGPLDYFVDWMEENKVDKEYLRHSKTSLRDTFCNAVNFGEKCGDLYEYLEKTKHMLRLVQSVMQMYIYILENNADVVDNDIRKALVNIENGRSGVEVFTNHPDMFFGSMMEVLEEEYEPYYSRSNYLSETYIELVCDTNDFCAENLFNFLE